MSGCRVRVMRGSMALVAAFAFAATVAGNALARGGGATVERPDLVRFFDAAGTQGAIVLHRLNGGGSTVANRARAATAYTPASTFKILNSLIAIEAGLVADIDAATFRYSGTPFMVDGKPFGFPECNADVSLRTAFRLSCIAVYQGLARRIGLDRYREIINRIGYGNGVLDQAPPDAFWLEGGYKVTAFQQIEFLQRLVRAELPFAKATIDKTKSIMVMDDKEGRVMRGKTGYLYSTQPVIGWFVGWVEQAGDVTIFALNLDITKPEHAAARISIVDQILHEIDDGR